MITYIHPESAGGRRIRPCGYAEIPPAGWSVQRRGEHGQGSPHVLHVRRQVDESDRGSWVYTEFPGVESVEEAKRIARGIFSL
jgi:hypothetical protein